MEKTLLVLFMCVHTCLHELSFCVSISFTGIHISFMLSTDYQLIHTHNDDTKLLSDSCD